MSNGDIGPSLLDSRWLGWERPNLADLWGSVGRNIDQVIQTYQFVMNDWLGVAPSVASNMFEKM